MKRLAFALNAWIFLLLAATVSQGIHGQQQLMKSIVKSNDGAAHPSLPWNYSKNGADWSDQYKTCNQDLHKGGFAQQSPMVMNLSMKEPDLYDWSADSFSFVPNFYPTEIESVNSDLESVIKAFNIKNDPNGKFQGYWAVEPKHIASPTIPHKYVKWEAQSVQFHYPAEHTWAALLKNGTNQTVTAAMEMQIYGYDINNIATACGRSKTSGLSLFFFLENEGTEATNKFFGFINDTNGPTGQPIDLSLLVDYSMPMHYPVYGYVGSLTQPPCTANVCWYLVQRALPITKEQLDYFMVQNVPSNARATGLGTKYRVLGNKSIFGKNSDIIDPDA